MSKTYDENLTIRAIREYWKRFAASVTAYANKYKSDLFFHTESNIIALQVAFSLLLIILAGILFTYVYYDISNTIVEGIRTSIASHADPAASGALILGQLEVLKARNLGIIIGVGILITIAFGYIVARITLAPARNALISQKQFIGNVAHELRTPLSIIKTNTEVALLDDAIDKRFKSMTKSNIEELDRISHIINNLLSLSAFTQPERVEFELVDISIIVTDVVKKLSHLAERKRLEVTLRKSNGCFVWGNAAGLEQIVSNLVKNAVNFTPEGGHIAVTTASTYSSVELSVKDSGIGIARKDLFRVFEPFYRAEQSRNRRQGGSGLGLAIVNELVKMHRGKIVIQSSVGQGTTAIVIFPRERRETRSKAVNDEQKKKVNEIAVDFSHHTL